MHIKNSPSFKSGQFYNLTAAVQENTLLNRGLIDVAGCAVPQAIMSNNKDEAIERFSMTMLYTFFSLAAPLILLPIFNKNALKSFDIVKNFKNNEKRIIEVSKKYLTKDSDYMVKGIQEKAAEIAKKGAISKNSALREMSRNCADEFEELLKRYPDKEVLRKKLLKAHEKIYRNDFLTTSWLWCLTPWAATEFTEHRTKKKGFSATFKMLDNSKIDEDKYKRSKKRKMIATAFIATLPALIAPRLVMQGIKANTSTLLKSNNFFKKNYGKILQKIKNNAHNFDYLEGIYMSKTIFASMWAICDYPNTIVSARDKYERKDRAIRSGALFVMFFGGDFVLNNVFGRLLDYYAKTKIMDRSKLSKNAGFFEKFKLMPHNFKKLESLKNIDPKVLQKTKKAGTALYWGSLLSNAALIGFALPAVLNRFLKNSVKKDLQNFDAVKKTDSLLKNIPQIFNAFKMS